MKSKVLKIFLAFVIYVIVFSSLPFIRQKEISDKFKKNFDISKFYKRDSSIAYAKILSSNQDAMVEKLRAIDNAKEKIELANYRFVLDESGKRLMATLMEAAKRGVKIDIILDGNTVFMNLGKNNYYLALANYPNVSMKIYNPINPLKPRSLMGRMHDKYMIIDDKLICLGGRNLENRFMRDQGLITYDWDILAYYKKRATDDALADLSDYFYDIFQNGKRNKDINKALIFANNKNEKEILSELEGIYLEDKKANPGNYQELAYENILTKVDKISLIKNPINIYSKEPTAFYQISKLLKNADKGVSIHTPYFIGNKYMYQNLEDISTKTPTRLFTNSPQTGVNLVGVGDYLFHEKKLRNMDIEILENSLPYSYHGKAFTVDDNISAVGSFNRDMRSTYIDTELMLVIHSNDFYKEVNKELKAYEDDAIKLKKDGTRTDAKGKMVKGAEFGKKFKARLMVSFLYPFRFLF